jgi:two-component system, NarL family, nitrate/nitrite response regulator NarL
VKGRDRLNVLIADDHPLFAESVQALLSGEEKIHVVGRAENGEEAVTLASDLAPDLVVMDISMPVLDGFGAARRIRDALPATCILFLTGSNAPADIAEARAAGGSGYVTKDRIATELVAAIYEAAGDC